MEVKKLSSEEFNEIYSKVPRLCVEVVIQNENGILLTKRAITPWKGKWHFPGAGVLYGETLEEAIKRTAKEEVNLEVEVGDLLGTIEFLDDEERSGFYPISLVYSVKVISGNIELDSQATEFDFFKEIPEDIIKGHKRFIEKNLL